MKRAIDVMTTVLGVIAFMCMLYLILGTAIDVAQRAVTGRGIPGVIEYAEIILVVLVFFSLAHTQRIGGHVSSGLLARQLAPRPRAIIEAVGLVVVMVFLVFVVWQAGVVAYESYLRGEYRLGLTRALIWPGRWAIAIGLAALILQQGLRVGVLINAAVKGFDVDERDDGKVDVDQLI